MDVFKLKTERFSGDRRGDGRDALADVGRADGNVNAGVGQNFAERGSRVRKTGVADAETWTAVEALSLQLAAVSPNPDRDAGQADAYPGRAMKEGSVGPDVGQIEQWLNGRCMRNCGEDYVTENFRFGPKETEGVRAAQERADLLVTGTVNEETWAALRAQSCECEEG